MKTFKRGLSLFLALVMLVGMLPTMGIQALADTITIGSSSVVGTTVADVATMGSYADQGFGTSAADGKVWTDKTVQVLSAADGSFDVTLSAMAQEYAYQASDLVADENNAADVLFILDFTGSMKFYMHPDAESVYYSYGDVAYVTAKKATLSRMYALVAAVNKAITIIMDANPNNRVQVCAYSYNLGGIYELLPLDSYVPLNKDKTYTLTNVSYNGYDGRNEDNTFTASGTSTPVTADVYLSVEETASLTVKTNVKYTNGSAFSTRSASPSGGTNTQQGIYKACKEFSAQAEKAVDKKKRTPFVLLMTDGGATGCDKNWTSVSGHGTSGTTDIETYTILTAAYMKDQIKESYQNVVNKDSGYSPDVTWFNVGVCMSQPDGSSATGLSMDPSAIARYMNDTSVKSYSNYRTIFNNLCKEEIGKTGSSTIANPYRPYYYDTDGTKKYLSSYSDYASHSAATITPYVFARDYVYFSSVGSVVANSFEDLGYAVAAASRGTVSPVIDTVGTGGTDKYLVFTDVIGEGMSAGTPTLKIGDTEYTTVEKDTKSGGVVTKKSYTFQKDSKTLSSYAEFITASNTLTWYIAPDELPTIQFANRGNPGKTDSNSKIVNYTYLPSQVEAEWSSGASPVETVKNLLLKPITLTFTVAPTSLAALQENNYTNAITDTGTIEATTTVSFKPKTANDYYYTVSRDENKTFVSSTAKAVDSIDGETVNKATGENITATAAYLTKNSFTGGIYTTWLGNNGRLKLSMVDATVTTKLDDVDTALTGISGAPTTLYLSADGTNFTDALKESTTSTYTVKVLQPVSGTTTYTIYDSTGDTKKALGTVEVSADGGTATLDWYTVTFDDNDTANEATNMPTSQVVLKGDAVTLPTETPEITDKAFAGWYKESGTSQTTTWQFSGAKDQSGADISMKIQAKDTVIYAKWNKATATVNTKLDGTNTALTTILDNNENAKLYLMPKDGSDFSKKTELTAGATPGVYTAEVTLGDYDIYYSTDGTTYTDTNVNINVVSAAVSQRVDWYTVTATVTNGTVDGKDTTTTPITVNLLGGVTTDAGTHTFTFIGNENHVLDAVTLDSTSQALTTLIKKENADRTYTYTFSNVGATTPHTIAVVFEPTVTYKPTDSTKQIDEKTVKDGTLVIADLNGGKAADANDWPTTDWNAIQASEATDSDQQKYGLTLPAYQHTMDDPLTLKDPVRAGYTFQGWEVTTKENATVFTAQWAETASVTINYEAKTYTTNTQGQEVLTTAEGGELNKTSDAGVGPATGKKGLGATATAKPGYTFVGWFKTFSSDVCKNKIEDSDWVTGTTLTPQKGTTSEVYETATYYAKFKANDGVEYTVNHYFQNLDGTYPATASYTNTPKLTGTTGETITIRDVLLTAEQIKDQNGDSVEGFEDGTDKVQYTLNDKADKTPVGENTTTVTVGTDNKGNRVINLYYPRQTFTVVFQASEHGNLDVDGTDYGPNADPLYKVENVPFGTSLSSLLTDNKITREYDVGSGYKANEDLNWKAKNGTECDDSTGANQTKISSVLLDAGSTNVITLIAQEAPSLTTLTYNDPEAENGKVEEQPTVEWLLIVQPNGGVWEPEAQDGYPVEDWEGSTGDHTDDESVELNANPITIQNAKPATGRMFKSWLRTVDSNEHTITLTAQYYENDQEDPQGQYPGNDPDVPDIYEAKVTYRIVNGTFGDSTTEKVAWFQLAEQDKENPLKWVPVDPYPTLGDSSTNGVTIPTTMVPYEGYSCGGWDTEPKADTTVVANKVYTYRYGNVYVEFGPYDPEPNGEPDGWLYPPTGTKLAAELTGGTWTPVQASGWYDWEDQSNGPSYVRTVGANLSVPSPTKDGYIFDHWEVDETDPEITILTAVWKPAYVIVDLDGGEWEDYTGWTEYPDSEDPEEDTYKGALPEDRTLEQPQRTGYQFDGWKESKVGDYTRYTALWTPIDYTLTILYRYEDDKVSDKVVRDKDGNALDYEATMHYLDGYEVESPKVEGFIVSAETISGEMPAESVEWTVYYTRGQYPLTIHYQYENGDPVREDNELYLDYEAEYNIPNPEMTGYTPYIAGEPKDAVEGTKSAEEEEITVVYKPNVYRLTVVYVYPDGTTETLEKDIPYGEEYKELTPQMEGYVPSMELVSGTMQAQDLLFYIGYTPLSYEVTYRPLYGDEDETLADYDDEIIADLQGGEWDEDGWEPAEGRDDVFSKTVKGPIKLKDPVRKGYTFLGWERKGNRYIAHWEEEAVVLSFHANGGYDEPDDENLEPGDTYRLSRAEDPSHEDEDDVPVLFLGWTKKRFRDILTAEDELPETLETVKVADDTTVYALWGYDENKNGIADVLEEYVIVTYPDENGECKQVAFLRGTDIAIVEQENPGTPKLLADKTLANASELFTGYRYDPETRTFTAIYRTPEPEPIEEEPEELVVEEIFTPDHIAYIVGYEDGTVRPQGSITRAEAATIFFRLLADEVRDNNLTYTSQFTDVNIGDWYNCAICTLNRLGIIGGYTDNTFRPNDPITRAELATIIARFAEAEDTSGIVFTDISGHWAQYDILRAAASGWITGYADGTFRPDQYLTRAETMTMINRFLDRLPKDSLSLQPWMLTFTDNLDPDVWYYLAVQEATNSHECVMDGENEVWTALTDNKDWLDYED